jgi:F1F0 ATPase subunit 2
MTDAMTTTPFPVFTLILALLAGTALGASFFGGLWWTVRHGASADNPALWFGLSLLTRTALVLAGFYLVGGAQWPRMLACLAGFFAARLLVLRWTRPMPALEARHAS